MRNLVHTLRQEDAGFTLTELLVYVSLLGVVLAAAYAGMFAIQKAANVSESQSRFTTAFADPMEQMSRIIMQATKIQAVSPYRIEVWTDRNLDGKPQLNAFYCDTAGWLTWEWWQYPDNLIYSTNPGGYTQWKRWVMDINNANEKTGFTPQPLFVSYNASNTVETNPDNIEYVKVDMVIDNGDRTTSNDVREISLREGR